MKKFLSAIFISSLIVGQAFAMEPMSFSDVLQGSTYYDAVGYLQTEGIVSGYPDGTFKPYQTINRAEFTKIVIGANNENIPEDTSNTGLNFSDVPDGAWYNPYLHKAVELGVIGGYPDGTFKPEQDINFAEASKIIVVAYGGEFAGAGYPPEEWYHKYVNILDDRHAIPTTINTFDQKITRGEMSEMIYRLRADIQTHPSMTYDEIAMAKGTIEGSVGYPSESIPPDMMVCADNVQMAETFCTYNKISNSKYTYGLGYKLPVHTGTYHVYAVVGTQTGLYSEAVPCGLTVACTNHDSIDVHVEVGQTVTGIDPTDWYTN